MKALTIYSAGKKCKQMRVEANAANHVEYILI